MGPLRRPWLIHCLLIIVMDRRVHSSGIGMLSAIDVFVSSHRRCRNDLISRFGAFRTLPIPAGGRARTPSPGLPTVLAVNLVLRSAISATRHLACRCWRAVDASIRAPRSNEPVRQTTRVYGVHGPCILSAATATDQYCAKLARRFSSFICDLSTATSWYLASVSRIYKCGGSCPLSVTSSFNYVG